MQVGVILTVHSFAMNAMTAASSPTWNIVASPCVSSQELQGRLCTADRQADLLTSLQTQHKLMLQHLEDACAVVELLQMQVVDAACDDPANLLLPHLVIPLIKERLQAIAVDPQVGSRECKGVFAPITNTPVCEAFPCARPLTLAPLPSYPPWLLGPLLASHTT